MKRSILCIVILLYSINVFSQNNYSAAFIKDGYPFYIESQLNMLFKSKKIKVETALLQTGVDTLTGYFGQIQVDGDNNSPYYFATIGTVDSLLGMMLGFKLTVDSLNYLSSSIEMPLSMYSTDKVNLSVRYSPDTKTVLYTWNNDNADNNKVASSSKIKIFEGQLTKGMIFPQFELQTIKNTTINTSDFKNKIIVLNWWHTGCGPCIKEMPGLNILAEEYASNENIVFIAICDSPKNELTNFLSKRIFKYIQTCSTPEIKEFFKGGYPQHVIINKEGKVAYYQSGGSENVGSLLREEIIKMTL